MSEGLGGLTSGLGGGYGVSDCHTGGGSWWGDVVMDDEVEVVAAGSLMVMVGRGGEEAEVV